jgi:DNA repair exonuclease SbcCD ATPase subunit
MELETLLSELQTQENELEYGTDEYIEVTDKIDEVEDEISDLQDKIDVYNIIPTGNYYNMSEFEVIDAGIDDRRYAVGDEDEVQKSCYDRVDNLIDDIGYEGFNKNFAISHIDSEKVAEYAEDFWSEDVYNNPEVYLDESQRQLSDRQEREIDVLEYKIQKTETEIENLEEIKDEDNEEEIDEKIEELQDYITEMEDEIESIKDDPDGDFPDDLVQEKIDELVDDARSDPDSFLNEHGIDWEDFVDKEEFIDAVIEADGYGHTLNGYDGSADEIEVEGTWYWVMRID